MPHPLHEAENIFSGTVLVETKPIIRRKGDLIHFIGTSNGIQLAMSRSMFLALTADALAVAREIEGERDNVIPLCELCVRHNLPRD